MSEILVSTDLYQVLQPFVFITRIFGFMPLVWVKQNQSYVLRKSLFFTVYSYLLGTFMMIMSINGLHEDFHRKNSVRMSNSTVKYVTLFDLGEVVVTMFVGIAVTPFRLEHLWRLLECFDKIDTVLPQKGSKEERKRTVVLIIIGILCALFVLTYELYLWGEISNKSGLLEVFFWRYFFAFFSYFMVFVQEMLYWNFTRLIQKRMKVLNDYLEAGLLVNKLTPITGRKKVLTNNDVLTLMTVYDLIKDSVDANNNFCNVSVLFIMFSCLLHLVVTPYFLVVEVINNGYFIFIFLQIFWTLLHIGRLMVIVETCQYCLDEHQKTVNLVFKYLICDLPKDVKDQLNIFASQLKGRKVVFSSFALMNISRSILPTIGGSIVTFLVILFQFGSVGSDLYYSRG